MRFGFWFQVSGFKFCVKSENLPPSVFLIKNAHAKLSCVGIMLCNSHLKSVRLHFHKSLFSF
jgi:hypothetical protein